MATPADAATAIEGTLRTWETDRPAALARRETVQLHGAVARAVYRAAGVPAVRLAAGTCGDGCPCRALDGRTVSASDPLVAAGEQVALANGGAYTPDRALQHPPFSDGCTAGVLPAYPTPTPASP